MTIEDFEKAKEIFQDINEINENIKSNERVIKDLIIDADDTIIIGCNITHINSPVLTVFKNDFIDFLKSQNARLKMNKTVLEMNLDNL